MNSFCIQAVVGPYCAIYRARADEEYCDHNAIVRGVDLIYFLFKKYINDCWRDYHEQTDFELTKYIDNIKSSCDIIHNSCAFNHAIGVCTHLFNSVKNIPNCILMAIKNVDQFRAILRIHLKNVYDELDNSNFSCSDKCNIRKYKAGENYFTCGC